MEDYKSIKLELKEKGYVVFEAHSSESSLLEIASLFGNVVAGDKGETVQQLLARDRGCGAYGSFSYSVGFKVFPWHTDTAYWENPVRYILLTSDRPSPCATLARTFESLAANIDDFNYLTERSVFMLDIPGRKRLLTPIIKKDGMIGYKLDFHIYKPMNKEAKILSELMLEQLNKESQRIVWTGNNVLILDNWRIIHAREDASCDKSRSLKRIYINELV